jgi:hypothetical protein
VHGDGRRVRVTRARRSTEQRLVRLEERHSRQGPAVRDQLHRAAPRSKRASSYLLRDRGRLSVVGRGPGHHNSGAALRQCEHDAAARDAHRAGYADHVHLESSKRLVPSEIRHRVANPYSRSLKHEKVELASCGLHPLCAPQDSLGRANTRDFQVSARQASCHARTMPSDLELKGSA